MQICNQCNFTNHNDATFCNGCGGHLGGFQNPLIDRIIDKYRLKEKIGGGGFGTVYYALHTELNNPVAIKILHPHLLDDEQMVERFKREAVLLAGLRHENIVQVIDFGHVNGIGFYLIMEWLEGKTLQWHLKEEGLPPYDILLQIFEQLLDALSHAHENQIVHRDLKPENLVLLTGKRNRRTLKILDFGIARMVNDRGPSRITETGLAVGTPRYMAPEQAAGEIDRVDHRADIYAVGILLTELLTGKQLFHGTTNEVLLHQIDTPAPSLSELSPEQSFPKALEWVLQRALAKDPEKRFNSALEFSDALLAILEGDSTHLGPSSSVSLQRRTPAHTPPPSYSAPHNAPDFVSPLGPQTPTHALPHHSGARSMQAVPSRMLKQPPLAETRALPSGRSLPPVSLLEREPPPLSHSGVHGEKQSGVYHPNDPMAALPLDDKRTTGWFWASIALLGTVGIALFFFILNLWEPPKKITPLKKPLPSVAKRIVKGGDLPGLPPQGDLPKIGSSRTPGQGIPGIPGLPDNATPEPTRPEPARPEPPRVVVPRAVPKRRRIRRRRRRRRRRRIKVRKRRTPPPRPRVRTTKFVSLLIKSIPSGASITINGIKRGSTPKRFNMPMGKGVVIRLN